MKYWVDFSGYVSVEADSREDSEHKFWRSFVADCSEPFSDDVWDIEGIEERIEFAPPVDVEAMDREYRGS